MRIDVIHQAMLRNFRLAIEDEPIGFKSHHWNHFPAHFVDFILDVERWQQFRRNGITAGYDDSAATTDQRFVRHIQAAGQSNLGQLEPLPEMVVDDNIRQGLINHYLGLKKELGSAFIEQAYDNRVGSPLHAEYDGKLLNITDLDHLIYAWLISKRAISAGLPVNPVICEIGGGFGGMACALKRIIPGARLILLDLPEVSCTQTYYVSNSFPDAKIVLYEDVETDTVQHNLPADFDFAILPGWCAQSIPERSIDLFINMRSMQEMNWTTIRYYLTHIERTTKLGGMFYCVNRYSKHTADQQPIVLRDFPFDDQWTPLYSEPAPRQKHIHQLVLKRTGTPDESLHKLLQTLPG